MTNTPKPPKAHEDNSSLVRYKWERTITSAGSQRLTQGIEFKRERVTSASSTGERLRRAAIKPGLKIAQLTNLAPQPEIAVCGKPVLLHLRDIEQSLVLDCYESHLLALARLTEIAPVLTGILLKLHSFFRSVWKKRGREPPIFDFSDDYGEKAAQMQIVVNDLVKSSKREADWREGVKTRAFATIEKAQREFEGMKQDFAHGYSQLEDARTEITRLQECLSWTARELVNEKQKNTNSGDVDDLRSKNLSLAEEKQKLLEKISAANDELEDTHTRYKAQMADQHEAARNIHRQAALFREELKTCTHRLMETRDENKTLTAKFNASLVSKGDDTTDTERISSLGLQTKLQAAEIARLQDIIAHDNNPQTVAPAEKKKFSMRTFGDGEEVPAYLKTSKEEITIARQSQSEASLFVRNCLDALFSIGAEISGQHRMWEVRVPFDILVHRYLCMRYTGEEAVQYGYTLLCCSDQYPCDPYCKALAMAADGYPVLSIRLQNVVQNIRDFFVGSNMNGRVARKTVWQLIEKICNHKPELLLKAKVLLSKLRGCNDTMVSLKALLGTKARSHTSFTQFVQSLLLDKYRALYEMMADAGRETAFASKNPDILIVSRKKVGEWINDTLAVLVSGEDYRRQKKAHLLSILDAERFLERVFSHTDFLKPADHIEDVNRSLDTYAYADNWVTVMYLTPIISSDNTCCLPLFSVA